MSNNFLQKQVSLILTKIRVPHGRKIVHRNRLIHILNEGVSNRITLLSAPAGFGKTTLLIEWAHQTDLPIAWISLDKKDNETIQFWSYFCSSIRAIYPKIGGNALEILQMGQAQSVQATLTFLINEAEQLTGMFVIILDDYHLVNNPAIHSGLIFLIDHLPEQIRLIISSRSEPPLHLAKWRVRGELTEIKAKGLRFTLQETAIFLNKIMTLDLSNDHMKTLNESTEGWIAGLQIAALSLRGKDNIAEFIHSFSKGNQYLCDYILEEIIDNQPKNIQSFLYETSILEQINASLCDSITNQTGSHAILEKLEKDNLFIIPVDDNHDWYRYHHLLVNSLRLRLSQKQPKKIAELHERAANWYEQNGYFVDAVHSYFAASNYSSAARLINRIGVDMVYRGEMGMLISWLERLPKEIISAYPLLLVYHAWVLISSEFHLEVAEECLKQADRLLQNNESHTAAETSESIIGTSHESIGSIQGSIKYLYSFLTRLKGDFNAAVIYAQDALRLLPEDELIWRSGASWNLAEAYRYRGDVDLWGNALNEAINVSWASKKLGAIILAMDNLAELQVIKGQLYSAERTWNYALQYADEQIEGKQSLLACTIYSGLGLVYYEWNRLEQAKKYLLTAIDFANQGGIIEISLEANISLARLLMNQGEQQGGIDKLLELEPIIYSRSQTKHAMRANAYIAYWNYLQGNHEYFYNWMQSRHLSLEDEPEYIRESEYFLLCRVMILEGKYESVLKLLQRIEESGRSHGRLMTEIKSLVFQAGLLERQGETAKAFIPLRRALLLGEPGGFVRTFIEASSFMFGLLNKYAARHSRNEYLIHLISAFEGVNSPSPKVQTLIEPLSERELEVLRLIAARLSSREIAVELNISVNTARTHIKNIYSKLDAHNHIEAALRAETLGLIS